MKVVNNRVHLACWRWSRGPWEVRWEGADVPALAAPLDKLKASIGVAGEREQHHAVRRQRGSSADARDRGMREQIAIAAGQDWPRTGRLVAWGARPWWIP